MKKIKPYQRGILRLAVALGMLMAALPVVAELPYTITLDKEGGAGWILRVDGEPVPINGVVWSTTPIGENYNYSLWDQDERFIRRVVDTDARLMKEMGVTAVRLFSDIPPKWVTYLYRRYGIYTIVNNLMARYGYSVDGRWYPNTPYELPRLRELVMEDVRQTIETYKDVPGVLLFMYGNENNYGLQWKSNQIEDLPVGERVQARARYLYSLFGEAIDLTKEMSDIPAGFINGDTQYLNIIAEEVPNLDILGLNIYRGERSQPILFESIARVLDKPIIYTEFGADAWNAALQEEDGYNQARFLKSQWREIYEQAYGKGRSQNIIGGVVFQWMDEWWKYRLEFELFTHNTEGTWRHPAYYDGEGIGSDNNMNEEWWGIIAQSTEKKDGVHRRIPRPAYYTVAEVWKESLYDISNARIGAHFDSIRVEEQVARADTTGLRHDIDISWVDLSGSLYLGMRGHFSEGIADSKDDIKFSHGENAVLNIGVNPAENLQGEITLRAQLGALDDVFYKSYAYHISSTFDGGYDPKRKERYSGIDRLPLELYSAAIRYDDDVFRIEGYYHDGITLPGHPDLILEGDFWGIYPETFDIAGMDRTLSKAPFGVEFIVKRGALEGLMLFVGPEIYWGAPPAAYVKYYNEIFQNFYLGLVHYEEFNKPSLRAYDYGKAEGDPERDILITGLLPENVLAERKSSLYLGYTIPDIGPLTLKIDAAALMAGTEDLDLEYTSSNGVKEKVGILDTFGAKGRLTFEFTTTPIFHIMAEYTYAGRVATGGKPFIARAGTQITEGGGSNRHEVVGGANVYIGDFVIAPKFRWRTPVDGPTDIGSDRNPLTSPLLVGGTNRGLMQAELVLTWDLTGATWFHEWDNDDKENAVFAASLGGLWTIYQDETDPIRALFIDPGAFTYSAHNDSGVPTGMSRAENLFRLQARVVSNFAPQAKVIVTAEFARDQNLGAPTVPLETSVGGNVDLKLGQWQFGVGLDHNIWAPEDWHYEYGINIPWEWRTSIAYHFGNFSFVQPENVVGLEVQGRTFEGAREVLPVNPLGTIDDPYRVAFTIFYQLRF